MVSVCSIIMFLVVILSLRNDAIIVGGCDLQGGEKFTEYSLEFSGGLFCCFSHFLRPLSLQGLWDWELKSDGLRLAGFLCGVCCSMLL
jgi:hypothetical protein